MVKMPAGFQTGRHFHVFGTSDNQELKIIWHFLKNISKFAKLSA